MSLLHLCGDGRRHDRDSRRERADVVNTEMSVYKLLSADSVHDLLAPKIADAEEDIYTVEEVAVGSVPAVLVYGETEPSEVEWADTIVRLTGVDVGFTATSASAALVVTVDGVNYALAFGHGRHYLREGGSHLFGGVPDWASVLGRPLARDPVAWTRFWTVVTRCGPDDGVRWRTLAGDNGLPDRVLVHDGSQSQEWSVGELLDQPGRKLEPARLGHDVTYVDDGADIGGNERLLLHIPDSSLI